MSYDISPMSDLLYLVWYSLGLSLLLQMVLFHFFNGWEFILLYICTTFSLSILLSMDICFHWTARRSNQSILKEISPGISLEGMMLKLKLQYFGHLMWRVGKDSDAERDWGQEEKEMTEDEMAGWHHWPESEWTVGVGDGQGGLECCDSWGCKESDTTERLNWTELNNYLKRVSPALKQF